MADLGFDRMVGPRPLEMWGTELKGTQGKCVSSFTSVLKEAGTLLPTNQVLCGGGVFLH